MEILLKNGPAHGRKFSIGEIVPPTVHAAVQVPEGFSSARYDLDQIVGDVAEYEFHSLEGIKTREELRYELVDYNINVMYWPSVPVSHTRPE